mgnify:FL=1
MTSQKWKDNKITEKELEVIVPTIELFQMPDLEDELDDKLMISNNGDSWDEVLEITFDWDEDLYFQFQKIFMKYRK